MKSMPCIKIKKFGSFPITGALIKRITL